MGSNPIRATNVAFTRRLSRDVHGLVRFSLVRVPFLTVAFLHRSANS
jgi:hypothetical protein